MYNQGNAVRIGRLRAVVDREAVLRLRAEGRSLREIARTLNVPVSRVRRALLRVPAELPEPKPVEGEE